MAHCFERMRGRQRRFKSVSLRTVVAVVVGSALLACSGGARRDKHTRVGDTTAGRVPGRVVVDFRDGTSAAVLAERAAAWGVSLRFNSLVGPEDGVALADGVEDVDALLQAIRQSRTSRPPSPFSCMKLKASPRTTRSTRSSGTSG